MKKLNLILNKITSICFILYFLILAVERGLAVFITPSIRDSVYTLYQANYYVVLTYVIAMAAWGSGIVLFIKPAIGMFKKLFTLKEYDFEKYVGVLVPAMVLLLSAMMHTAFTITALQFVAYAFLIIAMLMITIQTCFDKERRVYSIISFFYVTFYAMAVPVCYLANIENEALATTFYVSEVIASITLLSAFTCLLFMFLKNGFTSSHYIFPIFVIVLDALVISLRWFDEINVFLLVFASLTVLTYFIYHAYYIYKKKQAQKI